MQICVARLSWGQQPVHGAPDPASTPVENMGVDHCRLHVPVAEQLLDRWNAGFRTRYHNLMIL